MAGDLVEVVLVSFRSNNVNNFVEGSTRILFTVLNCVVLDDGVDERRGAVAQDTQPCAIGIGCVVLDDGADE